MSIREDVGMTLRAYRECLVGPRSDGCISVAPQSLKVADSDGDNKN